MKHFFGAVILSALIGTACSEDSNRTDRIVVLDSWWSLDHAKTSCEQATQWYRGSRDDIKQLGCDAVTACQENMPRVNACANDPGPEVLHFFDQLASQLASNTQCKGIHVVKYDGPNSATSSAMANTMEKPHRALIVDYTPGLPKQAWGLVSKGGTYMEGEGDPKSQPAFAPSSRKAAQDSRDRKQPAVANPRIKSGGGGACTCLTDGRYYSVGERSVI